jgi:hypothetical protein
VNGKAKAHQEKGDNTNSASDLPEHSVFLATRYSLDPLTAALTRFDDRSAA